MGNFLEVNTVVVNLIVGLIILLVIFGDLLKIYIKRRAVNEVFLALEKNLLNTDDTFSITKSNIKYYDLVCENNNNIFFVKIIHNSNNSEICVNNATRWQVRKSKKDTSQTYLKDVEPFVNYEFNPTETKDKLVKRIMIIYKDSRSLLMHINESEMVFIESKTNVYGSTVITFNDLVNDENLDLSNK